MRVDVGAFGIGPWHPLGLVREFLLLELQKVDVRDRIKASVSSADIQII